MNNPLYSSCHRTGVLQICSKFVYCHFEPDTSTVRCDCAEAPTAYIEFHIPTEVAEIIFSDQPRPRNIQNLLPDLLPALREIFITGTTPAEFDAIFGAVPEDLAAFKAKYAPLGYHFQD